MPEHRTATTLPAPSQTAQIRALLEHANGWLTTEQIHAHTGTSRLNSRCAEIRRTLRKETPPRDLVCEHIPGAGTGMAAYRWRIVAWLAEPGDTGEAAAAVTSWAPGSASPAAEPLALFAAAPRGAYGDRA